MNPTPLPPSVRGRKKGEGGITRVKSAKSQAGALRGFQCLTEREEKTTHKVQPGLKTIAQNHSSSDAKPKLRWERDFAWLAVGLAKRSVPAAVQTV